MAEGPRNSISGQLESIGKLLIAVAGVAYSIGFVLVSFDLAQYGVTNFSLARPQYVLAGVVCLIVTVIALVPPSLAAWFTWFIKNEISKLKLVMLTILLVSLCIFILISAIQFLEPDETFPAVIYYPALVFFEFLVFGLSCHSLSEARDNAPEQATPKRERKLPRPSPAATIIYGLMIVALWIPLYTQVFRSVESSRGGARHPKAHVVLRQPEHGQENDLQNALDALALDGLKTKDSVTVVLVDTDFVVLVSEEQHIHAEVEQIKSRKWWTKLFPFSKRSEPWRPVLINKALVALIRFD
jgi:hypothetical protein